MTVPHPISAEAYDPLKRKLLEPVSEGGAVTRLGKYHLIRRVGEGGMAVVYEAEDPELRRRVALKVLRSDATEPRIIQRLHREAAIAAQLRHPGIVRIHEVAMAADASGSPVHFIAMDYVEGRTFHELMEERTAPRKRMLEVLESVADAVGYAHEQGVVHRDLKPGNVLIDEKGRVSLADFGLARAASFATPLTRSNAVMGTPGYMAPEQVEGRAAEVDARADVYALGVMLYEILAGRLPFAADSLASLYRRILLDEPVPPTRYDRTVDHDLEWICLKAMEKDPARRYPSGRSFQQDLRRWLEEKPVEARPPSVLYRLRKRFRRHRAAVAVAGAALLALAAVAIPLLLSAARAREEALSQMRRRTEENLAAALALRRAGNVAGMKTFLENVRETCQGVIRKWPGLAEPHHLLGRMYRALMEDEMALACQEEALARDGTLVPALYERIILNGRRHARAIRKAVDRHWSEEGSRLVSPGTDLIRPEGPVEPPDLGRLGRTDPEVVRLAEELKRDLRLLTEAVRNWRSALPRSRVSCVEALLALTEGDRGRARVLLEAAVREDPSLVEAVETLAGIERGEDRYEEGIRWLDAGLEADQGYLPYLEARGEFRIDGAIRTWWLGQDVSEQLRLALADFERLLVRDSGRIRGVWGRAMANLWLGETSIRRSTEEAVGHLEAALKGFGEALRMDPQDLESWLKRSHAHYRRAQIEADRGGDPSPHLTTALADADRCVALAPDQDRPWMKRAILKNFQGRLSPSAPPPSEWFRSAHADVRMALARNPSRADSWKLLGLIHRDLAKEAQKEGRDPAPDLDEALKASGAAIERDPVRFDSWLLRGEIELLMALQRQKDGKDPSDLFRRALEDFTKALERNQAGPDAWGALALLHRCQGVRQEETGRDPLPEFQQAISRYEKAIDRAPQAATYRSQLGYTRLLLSDLLLRRKDDEGLTHLDRAVLDLTRAVELDGSLAAAWKYRGKAWALRGNRRTSAGEDPREEFRAAFRDLTRAVELDPSLQTELDGLLEGLRSYFESRRSEY